MGIGGTGMGNFAGLLKAAGHAVSGSDQQLYPPMSVKLPSWGIPVKTGYRPENLVPAPDQVIVGNVIRRENPEAQALLASKIPYTCFPDALGELFLRDKHSVVVAGTHGKTTTSALLAWLLVSAGQDPSMLVGGVPENLGEGFRLGQGPHFVVEGDEYDSAFFAKRPKFLSYHPKTLIITSIDYDHADIYPNLEAIVREFEKLSALVPPDGHIFVSAGAERALSAVREAKATVHRYGAGDDEAKLEPEWQAFEITHEDGGARFGLKHQGTPVGRFSMRMAGRHNVANAVAAIAAAHSLGVSFEAIQSGLKQFQGVLRRQTWVGSPRGIRILDDFAHHPKAVAETCQAVRAAYPEGRLFAVFEPRSATSSRKIFQEDYIEAFQGADRVLLAPVGRPELPDALRLDVPGLAEAICQRGQAASAYPKLEAILDALADETAPGDTILVMSNGAFGGIHAKLCEAIEARA